MIPGRPLLVQLGDKMSWEILESLRMTNKPYEDASDDARCS